MVVLFIVMTFTTPYPPLELAGALSMIAGVYIGGQSLRGSDYSK